MKNHFRWLNYGFVLLLVLFTVVIGQAQSSTETPEPAGTLRNPLNDMGPDPWLTYYEGNYYLATTTGTSVLTMRKSPSLAGLKVATPVTIYYETDESRCCNMWAPEFDLLDGPDGLRWYFYYTAGTAGTLDNQRSYVLESAGTDPMGPYTFKGKLYDPQNDVWSIDGSVMTLDGSLYFLSSTWEGNFQALFIAPMSNPWTLSGKHTRISRSQYDWEKVGLWVNEGPVALQHDDKTFIIYSASYCNTPDYKLGMLTYNGGDPLSGNSWVKNPEPVFQRSDANGVYGPGHNGFFKSPDGTEDWIVYHANDSAMQGCGDTRTTRVQKFTWNADGTPNFGIPVSTGEDITAPSGDSGIEPLPAFPPESIIRLKAFGFTDAYLRHDNLQVRVDFAPTPLADAQFVFVPGLADASATSIESVNFPGFYLRHQNNAIMLMQDDSSEAFAAEATWWLRPGLADSSATSFEAYDQPGSYIGKLFGITSLAKMTPASPQRTLEDATFAQEHE
ncbi:MAG: family 43 glycosylhydrolase [Chloroflexi bacterium]|nr:family 43 glycosylhydrolase [Chloroflexota bacterium]